MSKTQFVSRPVHPLVLSRAVESFASSTLASASLVTHSTLQLVRFPHPLHVCWIVQLFGTQNMQIDRKWVLLHTTNPDQGLLVLSEKFDFSMFDAVS